MKHIHLGLFLFAGIIGFLCACPARAIPAFARREGVSCQMCHFRMPELNADGRAYILRGLREEPGTKMSGTEKTETPPVKPALGEPLDMPWANYLSIMGTHAFNLQRKERPQFDAGGIDLLIGGPFSPRWSAFANPSFGIEEGGADVEQAYGQFNTSWEERFASARFGQLMPFAVLLNQGGLSMSLSTPLVLETPGDTGTSWTPTTLLRGVEVGAVDVGRWNVYLGAGQPRLENESTDIVRHTDFYASAEYNIRGDDSLTAYGYWGKADLAPSEGPESASFHRVGAFANFYFPETKVVAGFLTGNDKDAAGAKLDNSGYFLLAERLLGEQLAAYARYDHFRQDLTAGGRQTMEGPTIGISWWAQTQIRLTTEAQFLKTTGESRDRTLSTELLWIY